MKFELTKPAMAVLQLITCAGLVACGGGGAGDDAADVESVDAATALARTADRSPPKVAILPYADNGAVMSLGLGGTASDNQAVARVQWVNSTGGSGVASVNGPDRDRMWLASVPLAGGDNRITVTAYDASGNSSTASTLVKRAASSPSVPSAPSAPEPTTEAPAETTSPSSPSAPSSPSPEPTAPSTEPTNVAASPLKLGLTSTVGGQALPFTVGHALRQGHVPTGSVLKADVPDFQFVVKNRWPDGSAKFAVLSGRADLAANTFRSIGLNVAAAPAAATPLSTADLKATGITASVQFGAFGTAGWSAGDWDRPTQTWVSGPQMSAWTYRKPIGSDPHLVAWLEVRAYKGGRVEVMPWIENGYLNVPGPTEKAATATFVLGGKPRFSQALRLLNHQRAVLASGTTLTHWLGADPQVTPKHDTAYLMSTKLVPNYRTAAASSKLVGRLSTSYTPLAQHAFPGAMGTTGYHPSIGVLPEWDVAYFSTDGDPRFLRGLLINGYASGRYGLHYRDEKTNRPLRFSSYPKLVMRSGSGVSGIGAPTTNLYTPTTSGGTPPTFKSSHQPAMGYVPYLLTGWNYFLEQTQLVATANYLKQGDATRLDSKGVFETTAGANTTRGAAWAIRTLAQAAALTPDADPLRAEFVNSLGENIAYYHGRYVATPNNPLGLVAPYGDYFAGDPLESSVWMDDFFTAVFGYVKDLNAHSSAKQSQLDQFLTWKYRSVVGRLGGSGNGEYSYRYGAQYTLNYAPKTNSDFRSGAGPWYANWGQVARAMNLPTSGNTGEPLESGYPTSATGYWGNLMPAIAYAVDHGAAGAAQGWARVTSASNFGQQVAAYANDPVWGVLPRGGSSAAPVPEPTPEPTPTPTPTDPSVPSSPTPTPSDPSVPSSPAPSPTPTAPVTLLVAKSGAGQVSSSPAGISCGADCEGSYDAGTAVTLTAAPAAGSTFSGWGGACTGTQSTCRVTLQASANVYATFTSAADLTASVDALIAAMPANSWKALPNTLMKDVCPPPYNSWKCEAVMSAWSGGTYDAKRDRMVVYGGGHGDSFYNNVFAFDLPTLRWQRLSEMGGGADGSKPGEGWADHRVETCGFYPKGALTLPDSVMKGNYVDHAQCDNPIVANQLDFQQPRSSHTYGKVFIDKVNDRYCVMGGGTYPSAQATTQRAVCFDPETRRWSRAADQPSTVVGRGQTALDASARAWYFTDGSGPIARFDSASNTWATFGSINGTAAGTGDIDRARNHYYALTRLSDGSHTLRRWDLRQPGATGSRAVHVDVPKAGAFPSNLGPRPGFTYVDSQDRFFAWGGGRDVYTFNPASQSWARLATGGDDPGVQQTWGTFGRFAYSPTRKVFVLVNGTTKNVFIYKPQ